MHKITSSKQQASQGVSDEQGHRFPTASSQGTGDAGLQRTPFVAESLAGSVGLQQLQKFFASLNDPSLLQQSLLEDERLHVPFLQYASEKASQQADEPASLPLARALEIVATQELERFLFAHCLRDMGRELDKDDLPFVALQRARFMELLADESSEVLPANDLFYAGGLSCLEELSGIRLQESVSGMHLPDCISGLLSDDTSLGRKSQELFRLVRSIEAGDWDSCACLLEQHHIDGERAAMLYGKAAIWTWMLPG